MKITSVQIDGFGAWSDLKLEQLSDGLTVFYGPNEAGKTTLMQFVRSVLYGYSSERRERYLPPARGGKAGGSLGLLGAGGRFTVRRSPGSLASEDIGRVEVLASNGSRQGQHVLGTLLGGIDEPIFNNVFAVGLRELQELGTLDDTEAAAQLYKLTSGLDRVSLVDVMRDLEAARNRLLAADGGESKLTELIAKRKKLHAEIADLATAGQRWTQLAVQRNELQEEAARLDESIQRMERESRAVEVSLQVKDDWFRRADVHARLSKLGKPITLPENVVDRVDAINAEIAEHREGVDTLRRQRRVIVDEANAQPINRKLCAQSSRIDAICEHEPWVGSLEGQVKRLDHEIGDLDNDLRQRWEKLGLSPEEMPSFTPEMSHNTLTTLRGPGRAVGEAAARLRDAKSEREAARHEVDEIREQLAVELAETGESELDAALEEAGSRVSKYRRRIKLQDRLEKMERDRQELEDDRRELLEEQVLPISKLVWCGVPFIIGSMMVLGGVFWPKVAELGWYSIVLGIGGMAFGAIMKMWMERTATYELDGCERQLERLKKQLRGLKDERDELDSQLPTGGGALDSRVAAAEEYVKHLEELTPLDAQRQSAMNRANVAKEKVARAAESLKEARNRWREALQQCELPVSFTPDHIQQFSEGNDETVQAAKRLEARRLELSRSREELAALRQRIDQLYQDVDLTPASDDSRARLRQLASTLAEQRQWINRRKELKEQHRGIKREFRLHAKELRRLAHARRLLLHQSNAADEEQLRKFAARQAKIEQLTAEYKELDKRVKLTIGNQCPVASVAEVLETHGDDDLEQYWDRLVTRLQESQSRLGQMHESRGEMVGEMKTLAEDKRLPVARLQLSCIDEQIHQATVQWQVFAVTGLMLEAIRQIYETERQPETLAEASNYLLKLTDGRYSRVWTPLSEDKLRVDNVDGESLPLDVLSQGTREAVFISLRLALVAAYARRGAVLPLVLDDVLVNFDNHRARAAAEVLREFAQTGHQMLLFTCHQHMMRIFDDSGVEVRLLPARNGLGHEAYTIDESEPLEIEFEPEPNVEFEEVAAEVAAEFYEEEAVAEEETADEELIAEQPEEEELVEDEVVDEVIEDEPEPEPEPEYNHTIWDEDIELKLEAESPKLDPFKTATAFDDPAELWWQDEEVEDAA